MIRFAPTHTGKLNTHSYATRFQPRFGRDDYYRIRHEDDDALALALSQLATPLCPITARRGRRLTSMHGLRDLRRGDCMAAVGPGFVISREIGITYPGHRVGDRLVNAPAPAHILFQ